MGSWAGIETDVHSRVARLDVRFDSLGFDAFGISRAHLLRAAVPLAWLSRRYFRVRVHGLEHVPPDGGVLLVANHAGGYALDGAMIATAMLLDHEPPRLVHGMAERFLERLPFASAWAARCGQLTGLPEHADRLLRAGRVVLVFPEGASGTAKLFPQRNTLGAFRGGFVRVAVRTGVPIVPVAVLGTGCAVPTVLNVGWLGRALGLPYVPLTAYGVPLPLPARLDVIASPPLHFGGEEDEEAVAAHVALVKRRIAALIAAGLDYRRGRIDRDGLARRAGNVTA